ncbi:hypothetical protein [uncultured Faecalicoccus sp.]|uniref:hypothetical protein n=1 Tax=uncultured Faecalicoccus sp. TaxID=1971760 RepID=UPI00258DB8A5|nr:hypothetical protein [uncultured Faecalicoccus sp.]
MSIGFIISLDGGKYYPMYQHIFYDVKNNADVKFVLDKSNKQLITDFLLKNRIRRLTKGLMDFICYDEGELYEACQKASVLYDNVVVIFLNASFVYRPYVAHTLIKYKQTLSNLKYVLLYLDIIKSGVSMNANYLRENGVFDLVYTIDETDSIENKLSLWNTLYSKVEGYDSIEQQTDLYFCGASKKRWNIFERLAKDTAKHSINLIMDIVPTEIESSIQRINNINILPQGKYLSYEEVLHRELQATCILEVVQDGQKALTLRPYEAVAYNRKLLTNNRSILEFEFYNPRNMQYFERVEDIDWEWVKEDTDVDYGYNGEFSPTHLMEDICKRMNGDNK